MTIPAERIRQSPSRFPAIVLFPQAQVGTRWLNAEMQELVIAELDQTMAKFRADPRRIYLQGFSMGATGAYRIAYRWPERFAAIVAVAGRVEPGSRYTPEEIETDRRANPFVAEPDPFGALALLIRKIPVWLFHGDKDEGVPVEQSRRLVAALKKVKANVRYTEYPGVDHVGAPQKAFGETGMIEWLFRQRR
ncbi:MAG: prolyl oligopeptidase family serine peptidase [Acidobacteriota bacterium]|nr:prolyl oligopeptidase family serine peptidase [Acidobacteriota bacterium]